MLQPEGAQHPEGPSTVTRPGDRPGHEECINGLVCPDFEDAAIHVLKVLCSVTIQTARVLGRARWGWDGGGERGLPAGSGVGIRDGGTTCIKDCASESPGPGRPLAIDERPMNRRGPTVRGRPTGRGDPTVTGSPTEGDTMLRRRAPVRGDLPCPRKGCPGCPS